MYKTRQIRDLAWINISAATGAIYREWRVYSLYTLKFDPKVGKFSNGFGGENSTEYCIMGLPLKSEDSVMGLRVCGAIAAI